MGAQYGGLPAAANTESVRDFLVWQSRVNAAFDSYLIVENLGASKPSRSTILEVGNCQTQIDTSSPRGCQIFL